MKIAPAAPRATSRHTQDGLEISIPAKRNFALVLFLGAWIVGWSFGEIFVTRELLIGHDAAPKAFMGAWLVMWTIGGACAIYTWLWTLKGREIILLRPDALVIKRDLLGFGWPKEYDIQHAKNFRVAPMSMNPIDFASALNFWGVGGGPIAFDYGAGTVRMGSGLDEAESRSVVTQLTSEHQFPGN
jgi:hypothetical protein